MTSTRPKLSVIVPVGRCDDAFDSALESLLAQSLREIEIVLVLDGLGEGSGDSLTARSSGDERLRVIELDERKGAGHARNVGLRAATGTAVAFADSDDLVPEGAYEHLVERLTSTTSVVVSGRAEQFTASGRHSTYWTVDGALWSVGGTELTLAENPELAFDHTPWNKVIDLEWLRSTGATFAESTTCEDVSWWASVVTRATVDVTPTIVYRHRRHEASVTAGIGRGEDLDDWTTQTRAAIETYQRAGATTSAEVLGRRLVRREAWTRVRRIGQFSTADVGALAQFVHWFTTWISMRVFDELSAFPRTAYALLLRGEYELATDFVIALERPDEHTVRTWAALSAALDAALGPSGTRNAELWRERFFRPAVDAAQREEPLPVEPRWIIAFWDEFVQDGLDVHEGEVLDALRDGSTSDVRFLRQNRRLRAAIRRRVWASTLDIANLASPMDGRMVITRHGARVIVYEGPLSAGTRRVSFRLEKQDEVHLEFVLTTGRVHAVPVPVAVSAGGRFVRTVARHVPGGR